MGSFQRFCSEAVMVVSSVCLAACGTTSEMQRATPTEFVQAAEAGGYSGVVIRNFADGTVIEDPERWTQDEIDEQRKRVARAGEYFADQIARELRDRGAFARVSREGAPGREELLVTGTITRYDEGVASLRFWVGMGAGSSYFDATVAVTEGVTGRPVGKITVDKNSWPLGGGMASMQTPERFIEGAAGKVADELASYARR